MQHSHARNLYIGTTAERTTLATLLPADGKGATFYDTDEGKIYFWVGDSWLELLSGSAVLEFIGLSDVPASYTGAGGKNVKVKVDETGLEFVSPSAGSGDVVGPEGAVAGNLPEFADGTGKAISDSGVAVTDLESVISNTSGTNTGDQQGDGVTITGAGTPADPFVAASGSGDVVGPASVVDGHLAVFDGITGKLIKDGGVVPTGGGSTDILMTQIYL
jgi:hypothetical protein